MNFTVPTDYRLKLKESEKRDKYLELGRVLKKAREHQSDGDASRN